MDLWLKMAYSRPSLSEVSQSKVDMDSIIREKYFSNNGNPKVSPKVVKEKKVNKPVSGFSSRNVIAYQTKEDTLNQIDPNFYKQEQELLQELSAVLKKMYLFYDSRRRELRGRKGQELENPFRYKKLITTRVYIVNKLVTLLKELYRK